MIIEHIEIYGFKAAFRGMRSPLESWNKSDSTFDGEMIFRCPIGTDWGMTVLEDPKIGSKDLQLACKLIKGGSEHRKFLRQIMIWFDITIPRYVWTELDTYKVATVRNSCSTMHKLGTRDLTQDDFELPISEPLLKELNTYGILFRQAKVIKDHKEMGRIRHEYKNILPEGFLQKATFTMNYETALSMYFQRRNHRLPEWKANKEGSICSFIASLPYMKDFINVATKTR
jgi:hypothetical protein